MMRGTRPASPERPHLRTITEQVADAMRRRVRDENLQPGDRLGGEQELAAEYGVSRPTIREAIRIASHDGLLRSVRGTAGGIFVQLDRRDTLTHALGHRIATMLDLDTVSLPEMLRARISLELAIVRLAAERITPATVAELRKIVAEFDTGTGEGRVAANSRLHRTIARATGNLILEASIDWAFDALQPHIYAAVPDSQLDHEHAPIVEALARHDADGAVQAMSTHLERVLEAAELHPQARAPRVTWAGHRRVAMQLQDYIIREGLAPGDRLGREDELAERLNTSRSVLREALHTLTSSHLLRVTRGRSGGIFVTNTFNDGMRRMVSDSVSSLLDDGIVDHEQLFDARLAIEPEIASSAAVAAGTADVAALHAAIPDDTRFHRVLAGIAPNSVLTAITGWMFDVQEPSFSAHVDDDDDARALDQHRMIQAAVAAADAEAAATAMHEHLALLTVGHRRRIS